MISAKFSNISRSYSKFTKYFDKIDKIKGVFSIKPEESKSFNKNLPQGVKRAITIASGKGGVGKSTISVNIAVSLAKKGLNVGLLDVDIYGPSISKMMNLEGKKMELDNNYFIPLERNGIKCVSMGFFIHSQNPIVWRGMMITKVLNQLLFQTNWGNIDVLVIDTPP
jgi:ATP-binding protein involved in chromosome partitioning